MIKNCRKQNLSAYNLTRIVMTLVILLVAIPGVYAQNAKNEFNILTRWMHYSDAPNSFYHYLSKQAHVLLDKRSDKVASLQTLTDWQQRQSWIRTTMMDIVGPFPEKTPLNPQITQKVDKDEYRVENIVYESQPGYYVTSSLFIPQKVKRGKKMPAIVYCSGHSDNGYRAYQPAIINLVKKGFIVFAFDPIGQGERLGYYNPKTGKSIHKWPTWEHSYPGAQVFLTGGSMARYMIWDGIRAVDYLFTRKEVDVSRIGVTGGSGGGTQSAYIAAFDDRIRAAAPRNYVTSFKRLYEAIGPQDAEQNFFHGIQRGLDMADLLLVRAPKPTLMIATTQDMFPIQGTIETANEVSRAYRAYNQATAFRMVSDDAPHATTKKNREAMYAFFQKYLDNPGDSTDHEILRLRDEEIQVTKSGQLATSLQGETVFTLNVKEAKKA